MAYSRPTYYNWSTMISGLNHNKRSRFLDDDDRHPHKRVNERSIDEEDTSTNESTDESTNESTNEDSESPVESSDDEDVLAKVARNVIHDMKDDIHVSINDYEKHTSQSLSDYVYSENKKELKEHFYKRYLDYNEVFRIWQDDEFVFSIQKKADKMDSHLTQEESIRTALDRYKHVVISRLKHAIDEFNCEDDEDEDDGEGDDEDDE